MLADELDRHIRQEAIALQELGRRVEELRAEARVREKVLSDSFRLYRSLTGSPHAYETKGAGSGSAEGRAQPRLDQVLDALGNAGGPLSLDQLVGALPEAPGRGAVSAAVHRAVARGQARRVRRGVYELVDTGEVEPGS